MKSIRAIAWVISYPTPGSTRRRFLGRCSMTVNFLTTLGTIQSRKKKKKPMHTEHYLGTIEYILCFEFTAFPLRFLRIKSRVGDFTPAFNVFTAPCRKALGTFYTFLFLGPIKSISVILHLHKA